jgi:hypothetical protein
MYMYMYDVYLTSHPPAATQGAGAHLRYTLCISYVRTGRHMLIPSDICEELDPASSLHEIANKASLFDD